MGIDQIDSFFADCHKMCGDINSNWISQEHYEKKSLHLVEEMSELSIEIIKAFVRRKEGRAGNLYEEAADVFILFDQMLTFMDAEKFKKALKKKIDREKSRRHFTS